MGNITKTLIVLLVIGVGIAVYIISMQSNGNLIAPGTPYKAGPTPVVTPKTVSQGGGISTQDRAALFPFPGASASDQERANHIALVRRLARQADELSVNGCSPDPLVIQISLKKDFMIKSTDPAAHQIIFGSTKLQIPANGSIVVHPSQVFDKGQGDYGYYCDKDTSSGVFYVTP